MLSAVVVVFLLSFGRGKSTLKSNSYENVNVFSGGPRKICGPTIGQDMVSRRRILSRSRDDLHLDNFPEEEDDVWHIKEKLYKVRANWKTT
ncbi:hypothetical protein OUZ56_004535 [Daphnia magna]|uniref:Uncharacterized protein n=1 Tax=Daphnia magna TaxID=35525 RepID=A0ABQ9YQ28_9CRUS|nr:hypothetical protein OUZ56_004535 [Daphnia magna]